MKKALGFSSRPSTKSSSSRTIFLPPLRLLEDPSDFEVAVELLDFVEEDPDAASALLVLSREPELESELGGDPLAVLAEVAEVVAAPASLPVASDDSLAVEVFGVEELEVVEPDLVLDVVPDVVLDEAPLGGDPALPGRCTGGAASIDCMLRPIGTDGPSAAGNGVAIHVSTSIGPWPGRCTESATCARNSHSRDTIPKATTAAKTLIAREGSKQDKNSGRRRRSPAAGAFAAQ